MIETSTAAKPTVMDSLMLDKVYATLVEQCLILEDFTQLPSIRLHNGTLFFLAPQQTGSKRSLTDVVDARQDYYNLRLALAEERVFSHTDKYQRAKLNLKVITTKPGEKKIETVYNVNSIIGSQVAKWVLGILNQREDGNYYLEDSTLSVKVSFSQLEKVDPDSFFSEGSLVMCRGIHHDECLYIFDL
jgi:hypothetical protein